MRVISYNIRYDNRGDRENCWSFRKSDLVELLRRQDADIIGLQEVLHSQLHDIRDGLPGYAYIGVGRLDGCCKGEYAPIFYRVDRVHLKASGHFWISETPDQAGSKGWDAACERIVTWGEFLLAKNTEGTNVSGSQSSVFIFNTHLDHVGVLARDLGSRMVLHRLEQKCGSYPALLMGDMNCEVGDAPYKVFTGTMEPSAHGTGAISKVDNVQLYKSNVSLRDAMQVSSCPHEGPVETFNRDFADPLESRIDYFFVTPTVRVMKHATIQDKTKNGRYPSDHLPILVDIAFSQR